MSLPIVSLIEDIEDYLSEAAGRYDEAASAESLLEDALIELKNMQNGLDS